jgi:hypothetical protein
MNLHRYYFRCLMVTSAYGIIALHSAEAPELVHPAIRLCRSFMFEYYAMHVYGI